MTSTSQDLSAPNLHELELADWSVGKDPKACGRIALPISAADGVSNALVYLEVDAGNHIPLHTHSADETIVILEGSARATAGEYSGEVTAGDVLVAPAFKPHGFENGGTETLKFIGYFGTGALTTTFDEPVAPFGTSTFIIPLQE